MSILLAAGFMGFYLAHYIFLSSYTLNHTQIFLSPRYLQCAILGLEIQ